MQPTPANVHVDAALTNFSLAYKNQEYVADEVLPLVPVQKQSDLYFIHGKEHFDNVDALRSPNADYKTVQHKYSSSSYFCPEYGLEEPISQDTIENADPQLDPSLDAANLVTELLLLAAEQRCATEVITTNPPTTVNTIGAGTNRWDNSASDPVAQIEADRQTILGLGGPLPNRLLLGYQVLSALLNHEAIKDRVKFGGLPLSGGLVTLSALEALFQVEKIVVGRAVINTANQGQATVLGSVWGKNALLYYYPGASPGLRASAYGIRPNWVKGTGGQSRIMERYTWDKTRSEIIRGRWYVDELVTGKDFAALRKTVVA